MNHIQNHITVGAPRSLARAEEAINRGLVVCEPCYSWMEFKCVFECKMVKGLQNPTCCYLCESRMIAVGFMVSLAMPVVYKADGRQPETEWACNRCMIAWDGNGGECPYCKHGATHGKAFKSDTHLQVS